MRLSYSSNVESSPAHCALVNSAGKRIEIHLAEADHQFYLVALTGRPEAPATLKKIQGPYHSQEQALGARCAIVTALVQLGFEELVRSSPVWLLQAKGLVRNLDEERQKHIGDYHFDPKDVNF